MHKLKLLERETWQRPRNSCRNHYKNPSAKCKNLKEMKSRPVVESKEKLLKKPMPKIPTSVCWWLKLRKVCHLTYRELLQKCIKCAKMHLDSFPTVTTVLENWMLLQKTRRVYRQNIPDKRNKYIILILPSVLNLQINMQNMWRY